MIVIFLLPSKKRLYYNTTSIYLSLNINVNELRIKNQITDETWQYIRDKNKSLNVTLNIVNIEDFSHKYELILKKHIPLEKIRLLFCKSLNPDLLQFIRENYCDTLKVFYVIDKLTDPSLRYHNPFNFDADPLVLLVWKCKFLEELTLIGYEILEINLSAIAQLRNTLKIFHIPIDCVINLRFGNFKNDYFFENNYGNDTMVHYGIRNCVTIGKVSLRT